MASASSCTWPCHCSRPGAHCRCRLRVRRCNWPCACTVFQGVPSPVSTWQASGCRRRPPAIARPPARRQVQAQGLGAQQSGLQLHAQSLPMGLQAPVHPAWQGGAVLLSSAATQYPLPSHSIPCHAPVPSGCARRWSGPAPGQPVPVPWCQRGQQAQQQPCPGPGTRE